jgi:hypothetical protein
LLFPRSKRPGKDVMSSASYSVLEEPPPEKEATASLQAEGRPPTPSQAEGRPPTLPKWNFNLGASLDTPLATLPLVPADFKILERLPSAEPAALPSEGMFRGMEKCIKHHRHDMVG